MQGSPVLRLLIIIIAMGLMFIPLRHLTSRSLNSPAPLPVPQNQTPESSVHLAINSTAPVELEVQHLGKTLWKGEVAGPLQEQEVKLPFPSQGIELIFEGKVKNGTFPAAIRVSVTPPDCSPIEKTIWVETSKVDEVLLFKP